MKLSGSSKHPWHEQKDIICLVTSGTLFKLGGRANGRKVQEVDTGCQLREPAETYNARFEDKKGVIDSKNTYYWNINGI